MKYVISAAVAAACFAGGWIFTRQYLKKNKSELKKGAKTILLMVGSGLLFAAISVLFLLFITSEDMTIFAVYRSMILLYALFFIAIIDFKLHLIPNKLLLVLLGAVVISYGTEAILDMGSFQYSAMMGLLGCAVCFVIFFIGRLISHNGMGMGDLKLSAVMGLLLGLDSAIACLIWSLILAAITGAVLMISKKANKKTRMPLAPFFFVGTLISHVIFIITGVSGG